MDITFRLPPYLTAFTGQATVKVSGSPATVGQALESLLRLHPPLRDRMFNERNELREHVNVFLGTECIRFISGLETEISDGALISIIPAPSMC